MEHPVLGESQKPAGISGVGEIGNSGKVAGPQIGVCGQQPLNPSYYQLSIRSIKKQPTIERIRGGLFAYL